MSDSKTKKILAIITQSELGGAQQFLIQLINNLGDYNWTLATGSDGRAEIQDHFPNAKLTTVSSLVRNPSPIKDIQSLFEIRDLIINEKPDSLFLLSSKAGFNGSLAALLVPRSIRPRVIYRIGGWTFNDPGSIFKKTFYFLLEWISARWKDIIVVNSLHDFNQAKRWHITPRSEIKLIHNGTALQESNFLPKQKARQALLGNQNGSHGEHEIWLGTIANFYETKGLDILIDAIAKIHDPHIRCIIIGDGHLRPALEHQIEQLGLTDKVILAGKRNKAYQYLKAFDIYIQPSRKEGFPWAVLEAMAAGLPIIATRVGSIPEMITNNENGLIIEARNPARIAESIRDLISDNTNCENMGKQAYITVQTRFRLDTMVKAFHDVLS